MTDGNRRAAIEQELARGRAARRAAERLRDDALLDDALSRLSYAAFHHVAALLLSEGVDPASHRSLPRLLGQHFVVPGRLSGETVTRLSRLASYRSLADYERTWHAIHDLVAEAFADADALGDACVDLLRSGGWPAG